MNWSGYIYIYIYIAGAVMAHERCLLRGVPSHTSGIVCLFCLCVYLTSLTNGTNSSWFSFRVCSFRAASLCVLSYSPLIRLSSLLQPPSLESQLRFIPEKLNHNWHNTSWVPWSPLSVLECFICSTLTLVVLHYDISLPFQVQIQSQYAKRSTNASSSTIRRMAFGIGFLFSFLEMKKKFLHLIVTISSLHFNDIFIVYIGMNGDPEFAIRFVARSHLLVKKIVLPSSSSAACVWPQFVSYICICI